MCVRRICADCVRVRTGPNGLRARRLTLRGTPVIVQLTTQLGCFHIYRFLFEWKMQESSQTFLLFAFLFASCKVCACRDNFDLKGLKLSNSQPTLNTFVSLYLSTMDL